MLDRALAKEAYKNWCKRHPIFSKFTKDLSSDVRDIGLIGIDEMVELHPMHWFNWWSKEHNRFKHFPQRELKDLHTAMHHFLSDLVRGKLERYAKKRKSGKTKVKPEGTNSDYDFQSPKGA